jgi:hypothetical protein
MPTGSLSVDHPSHDLCRLPRGVVGLFGTADDALDPLTIAERCYRRQLGKPVQSVDPVFHAYEHITQWIYSTPLIDPTDDFLRMG